MYPTIELSVLDEYKVLALSVASYADAVNIAVNVYSLTLDTLRTIFSFIKFEDYELANQLLYKC